MVLTHSCALPAARPPCLLVPADSGLPSLRSLLVVLRGFAVKLHKADGRSIEGVVAATSTDRMQHGEDRTSVAVLGDGGRMEIVPLTDVTGISFKDAAVQAAYLECLSGTTKTIKDAETARDSALVGKQRAVLVCEGMGERTVKMSYLSR